MPILQNAKKALRVSKRKALTNQPIRSRLKTTFDAAKKDSEMSLMSRAFSAIDKAVKSHIIHRKKADHMKSQLAKSAANPSAPVAKKASTTKKTVAKKAAPKAAPKAAAPKKVASKETKKTSSK